MANYANSAGVVILTTLILSLLGFLVQFALGDFAKFITWQISLFMVAAVVTVTAAGVIIIGIPVYAIMQKLKIATLTNLALAGFIMPVMGAVTWEIQSPVYSDWSFSREYLGAYKDLIINGQRTVWGWLNIFQMGSVWGLCGSGAAVVFTRTMVKLENRRSGPDR